jgi:UDP-3-O-[3-hydroxymyristoyl] glucosamine N-acyltransferase
MENRFFQPVKSLKIFEIISQIGGDLAQGSADLLIEDVRPLEKAQHNHISFLSNRKYYNDFLNSSAGACIVGPDSLVGAPSNMAIIVSANPYAYYARLMQIFYPIEIKEGKISPKASIGNDVSIGGSSVIDDFVTIGDGACIGNNCHIMAGCFIGRNVHIGDNVIIYPGNIIEYAIIGNNTVIKSGAKIGQEGFGFATENGKHIKIRHVGSVIIGNNVEIGSGTTIDRGSQGDTIIEDGVMIDNLVQIGHNVKIGMGSVIVAQVGIAGSTELGKYCVVGGQSGFAGHLKIADRTTFYGATKIAQNIEESGKFYAGSPAMNALDWKKLSILQQKTLKERNRDVK